MISVQSQRINFTPFALGDAEELFLIRGDAEAMRYWDWPADKTRAETGFVARQMLEDVNAGGARIWTVRLESGDFIGIVDLSEIANGEADLGFMIRRDYWGKGFAFAACTLAMLNARAMNLRRLRARIQADNLRSRKLLLRLGFSTVETRDMEVRPSVTKRCEFFALDDIAARFSGNRFP